MGDSSLVVDGLLEAGSEFTGEPILVPDIAVAEVVNALFVQERVLHHIEDGRPYLDRLFQVVDAEVVQVVASSRDTVLDAYRIAARNGGAVYDCLFVALALRLGLPLKTRDKRQAAIMDRERSRTLLGSRRGGGR